jgi:hypothetical protein
MILLEELTDFAEARSCMENYSAKTGQASTHYVIEMNQDTALDGEELDLPETIESCEVRLNQYILTVPDETVIRADLSDGTLEVEKDGFLTILPPAADEEEEEITEAVTITNVEVQFDDSSTEGGLILGESETEGSIHLNDVLAEQMNVLNVYGTVDGDASMTVADEFFLSEDGFLEVEDLTVTGAVTAEAGATLDVRGTLNLGDTIVRAASEENSGSGLNIRQIRLVDEDGEEIRTGEISFAGSLSSEEDSEDPIVYLSRRLVQKIGTEENEDGETEESEEDLGAVVFEPGETIATAEADESVIEVSRFAIPVIDEVEYCVTRTDNALIASWPETEGSILSEESAELAAMQSSLLENAIILIEQDASGGEEVLGGFSDWEAVQEYMDTLPDSELTYIVELSEDVETEEDVTLPTNVGGILFRKAAEESETEEDLPVQFICEGEFSSAPVTTFENVELTVSTLIMEHSTVDTDSRMTIENIISNSADNTIRYDENDDTDILTINGTVTSEKLEGTVTVKIQDSDDMTAKIQKAALNIAVSSIEDSEEGYTANAVLLQAAKADASWFVIGSAYEENAGEKNRVSIARTTYKDGTKIRCDAVPGAAVLLEVYDEDTEKYVISGAFSTLQEAFDRIDQIADRSAGYLILLNKDEKNVVTKTSANLNSPVYAAEVTVAAKEASDTTIYYKNSISLRSNLTFRNVTLSPEEAKNSIALGSCQLMLDNCRIADTKKIAAINGSGVATSSSLIVKNSELTIQGTIDKVGSIYLDGASLNVQNTVNIGSLYAESKEDTLTGLAAITRSKGKITAVDPKLTVNTGIYAPNGITIGLQEQSGDTYKTIDFTADEAANIRTSGIRLVRVVHASTQQITFASKNIGTEAKGGVVKSSGYLLYSTKEALVTLSYTTNDGTGIAADCLTFAGAVAEINTLKSKRNYSIQLKKAVEAASMEAPATLTMPTASYVSELTIEGQDAVTDLYFLGDLTMTSNVRLKNVNFIQMVKSGNTYVTSAKQKSDYPALMTLKTGGYALYIDGTVTFRTPLYLNGGGKGTLTIADEGQLFTVTNKEELSDDPIDNVIFGSIVNFAVVNVHKDQNLELCQYGTLSGTTLKKSEGNLTVTTLNTSGNVIVAGKTNLTDVTMTGKSSISSDNDFNISGTLTSTTSEAYLYTRQKGTNKAPYLYIAGEVMLGDASTDRIHVGVYPAQTASNANRMVELTNAPDATGQLLTAKTASVEKFVPCSANVGNAEPYSSEHEDGYLLKKSGTAIYVYYGDQIVTALCKGDASDGNLENADVVNYYTSFQEAINAIDALRSKSTVYTLMLLKDAGSSSAPLKLSLPTYASKVIVAGQKTDQTNMKKLYYVNDLTLKCPTVFTNIEFNPMTTKKKATALGFKTGVYDLTLQDVSIGVTSGMAFSYLTGNAKQTVTLDSSDIRFTGNVTAMNTLIVKKDARIQGKLSASKLQMTGGVHLTAAGAVSVTNVINDGEQANRLTYTRTSKDVTNLSITGTISGSNPEKLILDMSASAKTESRITLTMSSNGRKTTLSDAKKLVNLPKAATTDLTFYLNGNPLSEGYQAVKANKGLYLIPSNMASAAVTLTYDEKGVRCLDYTQAINEIQALSDGKKDYVVTVENISDTNLTDNDQYSKMLLPAKNMANTFTIAARETEEAETEVAEITFTGALSGYGNVTLRNIRLNSVKSKSSAASADFNITIAKSNAGASLTLDHVSTGADAAWEDGNAETTGFLSQILGTKNATNVTIRNSSLRLKSGLQNINNLTLEQSALISCGTSAVNKLTLDQASSWDALGSTTIVSIDASKAGKETYLATKQAAKTLTPQMKITGEVSDPIRIKVIRAASSNQKLDYVGNYKDVKLVAAVKASADKFIAWPYGDYEEGKGVYAAGSEELQAEDWVAYKDRNGYVINGSRKDMVVLLTKNDTEETYARSFEEAVTLINSAGDTKASYVIQFLDQSGTPDAPAVVKTAANNTFGAMTLPTKAASVVIRGVKEEQTGKSCTLLEYTGTLQARCNLTFEDILLTEGTWNAKKKIFTPSAMITIAQGSNNYRVSFSGASGTWKGENAAGMSADMQAADLIFNYVKGSKGSLCLDGRTAYVKSYVSIPEVRLVHDATLRAMTYMTISRLYVLEQSEQESATLRAQGAMTISDIYGQGTLKLDTCFSAITKSSQTSVTQLNVAGTISSEVGVQIIPRKYDLASKSYHLMTLSEAAAMDLKAGRTPSAAQKIASFAKGAVSQVTVLYDGTTALPEEYTLYKYNGGLYLTTQTPSVHLTGYKTSSEEVPVYEGDFLDWDQAVKEIDRIADYSITYEICLNQNQGVSGENIAPYGTLSMPTKAKAVHIQTDTESQQAANLFFTGTTLTIRCNTTFKNVGLMAVKKSGSRYESTTFHISVGNYSLEQDGVPGTATVGSKTYKGSQGTINGKSKGTYIFQAGTDTDTLLSPAAKIKTFAKVTFASESEQAKTILVSGGISGVSSLLVDPGVTLKCTSGDISVTNLQADTSTIEAKNITSTGTATLTDAWIKAGTNTAGDGISKWNNLILASARNRLEAKQSKKGVSQLTINGTVTQTTGNDVEDTKALILVGIYNKDQASTYVPLSNGLVLATVLKASDSWFAPYDTTEERQGMGELADGYGVYKSGHTIKYGRTDNMEVRLHTTDSSTLFSSFEEAVDEINYLKRYKTGTKTYEDYEIELLKNAEIRNSAKKGIYSALTLPTCAGHVRIYSELPNTGIYFAGNLTLKCNTTFENVGIYPMKAASGASSKTQASYILGGWTLELNGVQTTNENGNSLVGSISSSSSSGCLSLVDTELAVSGKVSVYKLCFRAEEGKEAVLAPSGSLTATLIYLNGKGESLIRKPVSSSFVLNGADIDVNGDGVKEHASVIRDTDAKELTIQLKTTSAAIGTRILTCKYLDLADYVVTDQNGVRYLTYQSGSAMYIGNALIIKELTLGDKVLQYSLEGDSFIYNGLPVEPKLVLKDEEYILEEGTDYSRTYNDNINAGTVTMTITGLGENYQGSAELTFKIQRKSVTSNDLAVKFTGNFQEGSAWPEVRVTDSGRTAEYQTLNKDTEYTLIYDEDTSGTLTAAVTGIGNYKGKTVLRFTRLTSQSTLKLQSLSIDESSYNKDEQTFTIQAVVSAKDAANFNTPLYLIELDNQGKTVLQFPQEQKMTVSDDESQVTVTAVMQHVDSYGSAMLKKYALAVIRGNGYQIVSSNSIFIRNPEVTAVTTTEYYGYYDSDDITSKKGMQGTHKNATKDLGIQAALLNINLNELIKTKTNVKKYGSACYVAYEYKGKTYYFHDMISYQQTVYDLNGWNGDIYGEGRVIQVSLNLLLKWDDELKYLIHPSARTKGKTYYALNMTDATARETFEALFCYMSEKLGGSMTLKSHKTPKKTRVCNWILGNEVNACKAWNYSGSLSTSACADNYAEAFQLLYQSVKQNDANARIFISLDHSWNVSSDGHSSKAFLDQFAAYMYKTAPSMRWNVNFHPYSQPLTRNDFWNDNSNTTSSESTRYISMKNLSVLTNYLGKLEKKYFPDKGSGYIRVILGEQGYIAANKSQEASQAEAIRREFEIAYANTRVDSVINRAYKDDPAEGVMTLGVMYKNETKKKAYYTLKAIK